MMKAPIRYDARNFLLSTGDAGGFAQCSPSRRAHDTMTA